MKNARKPRWFKWYCDELIAGTMMLSNEQLGCFVRIIAFNQSTGYGIQLKQLVTLCHSRVDRVHLITRQLLSTGKIVAFHNKCYNEDEICQRCDKCPQPAHFLGSSRALREHLLHTNGMINKKTASIARAPELEPESESSSSFTSPIATLAPFVRPAGSLASPSAQNALAPSPAPPLSSTDVWKQQLGLLNPNPKPKPNYVEDGVPNPRYMRH